jgi:hypothetical protein
VKEEAEGLDESWIAVKSHPRYDEEHIKKERKKHSNVTLSADLTVFRSPFIRTVLF